MRFAGKVGAAFVGVNPLHALRAADPSPYAPLSRLFRNPLYLELEAVPEWRAGPEAEAWQREGAALRRAERLDTAKIAALQRPVLEALHRRFLASADPARRRAFAAYCEREGELVERFGVFRVLEGRFGPDWRQWPAPYRDAGGEAVRAFAAAHREAVSFHAFAQFELDRQLAEVAAEARRCGLALGLYQDLALGSAADGFDPWAFPDAFAPDSRVGAPPDAFNPEGQDWGFPPLAPERLADADFGFTRRVLRTVLAHAGVIRIDHILGFRRQWWISAGAPASAGRYVPYPARELLGVLAEESRRHGAIVVGEDLGTVPRGLASQLARFGVLSSRVLYFERTRRGGFRAASAYSRRALVTANTHDLPTLPAWWTGRDLALRRELGLLDAAGFDAKRAARERDHRALARRLRISPDVSPPELCAAVHAFLGRTPAPLVGISLDDLAGETLPVNLPGVGPDRYPSWTRRMGRSVAELANAPDVMEALGEIRR